MNYTQVYEVTTEVMRILLVCSTIFMFATCITNIITLFIVPTTNHRIKKKIKIITLDLTCFGSRRNHLQGAVLCLAKTT